MLTNFNKHTSINQSVKYTKKNIDNEFIQAQIKKKNINAPRHWPLWGEFTGDRWIPRTKGQ